MSDIEIENVDTVVDDVFKSPTMDMIESFSDFEKFESLNKELDVSPKIDIDGNKYTKVSVRLNLFRKYFGLEYSLSTERIMSDDSHIIFKTSIVNVKSGRTVASGHSEKKRFSDNFSAGLEFAETASIGRALSSFGIIGGEFSSLDELGVQSQELAGKAAITVLSDLIEKVGEKIELIEINLKHKRLGLMLKSEALELITKYYIMAGAKKDKVLKPESNNSDVVKAKRGRKPKVSGDVDEKSEKITLL